jgi:hypothetical protein
MRRWDRVPGGHHGRYKSEPERVWRRERRSRLVYVALEERTGERLSGAHCSGEPWQLWGKTVWASWLQLGKDIQFDCPYTAGDQAVVSQDLMVGAGSRLDEV